MKKLKKHTLKANSKKKANKIKLGKSVKARRSKVLTMAFGLGLK